MYSVMWSEHCSYKSSKVHLRYFGETTTEKMRAAMLAGIGENAGVVDIGDGWAATFKVESHNHPSYVEPYQGAATGVGGIVRDIMAMGARPVAVMDQLRFGAADAPDTRRVLDGVVRGIGGYGNSLGLPNIGGETVFDAVLRRQPVGQRAVRRRAAQGGPAPGVRVRHRQQDHPVRRAHRARRHRRGVGARLGDLRRRRVPGRPQEAAQRAGRRPVHREGAHRVLPRAVRRPIWWSASRTSAAPDCPVPLPNSRPPGDGGMRGRAGQGAAAGGQHDARRDPVQRVAGAHVRGRRRRRTSTRSWRCAASGRCWPPSSARSPTATGCEITWHGETVVDVPPRTVAHEGPVYERPVERPDTQDALNADTSASLPRPSHRRRTARDSACDARQPAPVQPRVHHRAVRPLRARQHRARRERRRRCAPRRRDDRPRHRDLHRRVGPLHRARPVHRRPARAGRGVPQRRGHRGHADRGDQLPELRLPGGSRRDVAVLPGRPRPRRRLLRRLAFRSPAATSASTTRPAPRRSCRPRWSACSASSTT